MNIRTKGNVEVDKIKAGDIHYEYEYMHCIKSKVLTLPVRDESGYWTWTSERESNKAIITYGVREGMAHYAPNIYDYEAYPGAKML